MRRLVLFLIWQTIIWAIGLLLFVVPIGTFDFFWGMKRMSAPSLLALWGMLIVLINSLRWIKYP